jgi:hypothetical protein
MQEQHTENQLENQIANLAPPNRLPPLPGTRVATLRQDLSEVSKRIMQLRTEIAAAAKCPAHGRGLFHHRNRLEDLYVCEFGPHFLLWTSVAGKPALLAVATLALPGLDYPMTEDTSLSPEEIDATQGKK